MKKVMMTLMAVVFAIAANAPSYVTVLSPCHME